MTKDLFTALRERRSIYGISKESPISDQEIQEIVEEAVKHTPSAFNSQSTRVVLLLGQQHDRLWDITTEVLRAVVPADQFSSTEQKMNSFRQGYGTVLFFEDQTVVESLQKQFPLYQDNFPVWSEHTNAMHQLVIWMGLEAAGLGASLQHYNPLIDEQVKAEWNLPETWKLIAQMPFGKPTAPAGEKDFQPLSERVKVFR
ncbi:MAG: nitroreductase family protein [Alicyclobacillus herbarius]|uniref:nitroreductase family protein n=1 Tax=Alicyclobacillus herbarius TaxID=122960 RepID=UPI002354DCAF|nr:nitroreductase family protein [Alicyclobacillus herbarius]MCL6633030.1 nitroreductase family protein [Alicyclobacillus herbarius]